MKNKKYLPTATIIALSVAIALILWLTIFSRLGTDSRHFYPPLWSYKAIASGSSKSLFENIGNVALFIPIGITAALLFNVKTEKCFLIGFLFSLLIECCQWFFWLGSFEFDDLFHNTIGVGIGAVLINITGIGEWAKQHTKGKKNLLTFLLLVGVFVSLPLIYHGVKVQEMKHLAALNNREDGAKNLMTLSPNPKYVGNTGVSVTYKDDGSIVIAGKSESRAWIRIAKFALDPGYYVFEGLSDMQKNSVGLELAIFDNEQGKYVKLGHEVGAHTSLDFQLKERSKMEVFISLFPGWAGEANACPVIYRED